MASTRLHIAESVLLILCHCHLLNAYYFTYNQVPVFEFNVESNHVMRRRHDHYINATHILKVADYDKPARTRILEREVQKGVHEKIQGGYGKYQG
jgi:transcription factor MBP1